MIKSFHKYPPIIKTFGMQLSFDDEDNAIITLPYNPNLDRGRGGIHGGAIATILDNAGFFTSALATKEIVITSQLNLHLLRPAKKVKLIAKGKIIKVGKTLVVSEMSCKDEHGTLIAHATGTYLRINRKSKKHEKG